MSRSGAANDVTTLGESGVELTSPYLTTREAAQYLGYRSTSAIREAVRRGRLEPVGWRGTHLFTRQILDDYVRSRRNVRNGNRARQPAAPQIAAEVRASSTRPRTSLQRASDRGWGLRDLLAEHEAKPLLTEASAAITVDRTAGDASRRKYA